MSVVVVGLSHKTAVTECRAKFTFPEQTIQAALGKLVTYPGVNESLIVSTCNRVEIYASVKDAAEGTESIKRFITDHHGLSRADLDQSLYVYADAQGVRHVFRVASSLDSLVVGEPQILGQLKDAFDIALQAKTTSTVLNKLLKKSISVAKRVRTETKLAEGAVNISYAAVELAKKIFGSLEGKSVMLLGAGEMAELAARHLMNNKVEKIMVANRTFERAEELAREFKGDAIRFEHFPGTMVMADILICSTGAQKPVVTYDIVKQAARERRHRPLFLIDISMPPNIEAECDKVDGVYLYNIDALQGVVDTNVQGRQQEAERAEEIVHQEVETYLQWERSLDAVPTIVDLREKVEEIRKRELEKTLCQMNGVTEDQKRAVDALSSAIVNKIVHAPMVVLKQAAAHADETDVISIARKLFNLDKELIKPSHVHAHGFGTQGKDEPENK